MGSIRSIDKDDTLERLATCTGGLSGRCTRVAVSDLQLGMRVDELDKPWLDSDFLYQGFYIESEADLEKLRRECRYVYVNLAAPRVSVDSAWQLPASRGGLSPAKVYQWPRVDNRF